MVRRVKIDLPTGSGDAIGAEKVCRADPGSNDAGIRLDHGAVREGGGNGIGRLGQDGLDRAGQEADIAEQRGNGRGRLNRGRVVNQKRARFQQAEICVAPYPAGQDFRKATRTALGGQLPAGKGMKTHPA